MKQAVIHLSTFTASVLLAVLFAISPVGAAHNMSSGAAAARGNDQPADLFGSAGVFSQITNVLLFIVGAISVIMIIIGGLRYVISGGDSANVSAAKNTILYAVIGVVVALLAYAIVNFVLEAILLESGGGGGSSATNF